MKKLFVLIIVVIFLTGCMKTTQTVANETYAKWNGVKVNNFFLRYGPPSSVYSLGDDKKIYTWSGGQASVTMPMSANTNYYSSGYGMGTSYTTITGGQTINMGCTARINTTNEVITGITLQDTTGAWRLSRCDEVLNPDGSSNKPTVNHSATMIMGDETNTGGEKRLCKLADGDVFRVNIEACKKWGGTLQ
jgi:hypothetical protein